MLGWNQQILRINYKKAKKEEHIWKKSDKMLIDEKNIIGGFRYAQFILYRKVARIASGESKKHSRKRRMFFTLRNPDIYC